MKYNYALGILLAILFPGLIQYYIGERSKGNKYIIIYLTTFVFIFIILTTNNYEINLNEMETITKDPLLIKLSIIINVCFRLFSGIDGILQLKKIKGYYN